MDAEHDQDPTPQRELRDPRELRALAHPVRLRLLEELATLGEATATQLGGRIGESPANCSWHLRQLARYGFIEEADGGAGRQRPWRWVPQAPSISPAEDDTPETRVAHDAAVDLIRERDLAAWRAWWAGRRDAPQAWQQASFGAASINWLTADELRAFKQDIDAVIDRHLAARLDRFDPARRPPGAHLIRFGTWGFPAGAAADLPAPATDGDEADLPGPATDGDEADLPGPATDGDEPEDAAETDEDTHQADGGGSR